MVSEPSSIDVAPINVTTDPLMADILARNGISDDRSFVLDEQPVPLPLPEISIILPTRNEAENIAVLIERLEQVLGDRIVEVIFVDDSDDHTVAAIESAQTVSSLRIRYLHRHPEQRSGGLSSAVVAGLRLAQAPWACVMDADLQHPPELVPRLYEQAVKSGSDIVVGSRYCQQGKASGLNQIRSAISRSFTTAAKITFPGVLSTVSDPMSGFFLVRTDAVDLDLLKPNGFKILLEILARSKRLAVTEVGFEFGTRHAGESKASLREGLRYLSHLMTLRVGERNIRLGKFAFVGISGIAVNLLILLAVTELLGLHYLVSVVIATQGSTLWNFVLTDRWVYAGRRSSGSLQRYAQFFVMNNAALLLRGPMIYLLTAGLLIHYSISTLISLIFLGLLRFAISDSWIWGKERDVSAQRTYSYDIHGLMAVTSDVKLPELQQFLVPELSQPPTIKVRVGGNSRQWNEQVRADPAAVHFAYSEGLGPIGFSIKVAMSDHVDVLASPILRWSPHVLYTNVVEPILRWSLIKQGYALVHGACLAYGDNAYLVTARTDTGKTTTLLKILSKQRHSSEPVRFLSDDLTLVSAAGDVLSYPKPLTISSHTVAAIDKPQLSRWERAALVIQSRLHSRDGRRIALRLANTRLPMATVNTIVQLLVPPPKYLIQRLIPAVQSVEASQLAGLFVIERGDDDELQLTGDEAYDILMRNSEDAFGFPPYSAIASFLQKSNGGEDLVALERQIVARALHGLPTTLIRSSKMAWADRIPAVVNGWNPARALRDGTVPELALENAGDD